MKRLVISSIAIVLVVFSSLSVVAAQTPVAYVLEIEGDWRLNRNSSTALTCSETAPC